MNRTYSAHTALAARTAAYRRLLFASLALTICATALATLGCSGGASEDESDSQVQETVIPDEAVDASEVEDAVRAYAETLALGLSEQDLSALDSVATPEQAAEEQALLDALTDSGTIMYAEPVDIEFLSVQEMEDGSVIVETREVWDFEQISLETSEPVSSEDGSVYELQYALVRTSAGGWFVASITSQASDEDTSAPSGESTGP